MSHSSDIAAFPPGQSFVQAAVEAVLKAGWRPVDMAQFAARGDPPADYCKRQVRACDVYLGIVGFRYGSRVPDQADGLSYTEFEFLIASEVGLPRLVFLLDEGVAVPRSLIDRDSTAVDAFRERLLNAGVIVKTVHSPADLTEAVLHALYEQRLDQATVRRPWMAPPLDRVVERSELCGRLVAALIGPGASEVALTTALAGIGGVGKTTLAAWACHHPEVTRRYPGGLLWVTIGQEVHRADLAEKVNDLALALSGNRPLFSDPDAAGAELGRLLDKHNEPVLLVIDDVWELSQLRPFRYGGRVCTRLATTRMPDLLPINGLQITVDMMSAREAADLTAHGVDDLPADAADRLAAAAGRWPVLLNLVNGSLRRRAGRGQEPESAVAEILGILAAHGPTAFDPARPSDRAQAVETTVAASLVLLSEGDRDRYLDLAIFPEDVDLPLDVLTLLWPGCRVEEVCEQFAGLGLVADLRLDPPGPRLVLHDVLRAYLRTRRSADQQEPAHRRLVEAAGRLLPAHEPGESAPWWQLPDGAGYLWRFLPYHLQQAGKLSELDALVCDLRWVEAKTRLAGSAVGAIADAELADSSVAAALARELEHSAHLLGPIDPPAALGATLASRLHGLPDLDDVLRRHSARLPRPLLEPVWTLPDRPNPALPSATSHAGPVTGCAFSPDGALTVTIGADCTARLWRRADRAQRAVLEGHAGGLWDCAFSPDGVLLATVSEDRTARLWQVADGAELAILRGHADWVTGCAFSPDGSLLATASLDGTVRLWRVADYAEQGVLTGHTSGLWGCAFSPDGSLLATTSKDGTVCLWRVTDHTRQAVLTGHGEWSNRCAFSPDSAFLAATGEDGTTRLWRVADGKQITTLVGHTGRVWDCAYSPDGARLATSGIDGTIRLWHMPGGAAATVLTGHTSWVHGCAFSPDGALLATASNDGTVRQWQMPDGTAQAPLSNNSVAVRGCEFSPDGTLLAIAGSDGTALRRIPDGAIETVLIGGGDIWDCAFSPDGILFAAAGTDGTAVWRLHDSGEPRILDGHGSAARGCTFSPDGGLLATIGDDLTARLWDVNLGVECAILTGHSGRLWGCAFSPDATLLATVSYDRTARLWRVSDGTQIAVLKGHTDVLNWCEFSPDGALLATTSDDRTARLWRVSDGTQIAVLKGHTGWVERCAFSPDGTLGTVGSDGMVRLWDTASGCCLCAIRVNGPLINIAWHPDGNMLSAVGGKGVYLLNYLR